MRGAETNCPLAGSNQETEDAQYGRLKVTGDNILQRDC